MSSSIPAVSKSDYPNYNVIDRRRIGMLQSAFVRLASRRHIDERIEELVEALTWSLQKLKAPEQIVVVPSSYIEILEGHRDTLGLFKSPTPIQKQQFSAFDWLVLELAKTTQGLELRHLYLRSNL